MNGYVTKPFKAQDLFTAVDHWTTPAALASPPVDLEGFRRTMREADAEDAVEGIVATFVTNLPALLATLVAAVQAKDGGRVERAAHTFKSAAAAIGAGALATLLAHLETVARDGQAEPAGPALESVRNEVDAVFLQLRAMEAL